MSINRVARKRRRRKVELRLHPLEKHSFMNSVCEWDGLEEREEEGVTNGLKKGD